MNAQPSFDPPQQPRQRHKSIGSRQSNSLEGASVRTTHIAAPTSSRPKSRVTSNRAYAHRRQGLEAMTKLVTYSTLSLFGVVTLVNSIGYNLSQHSKLKHLETELQEAKVRTAKINADFSHSFDPEDRQSVMEENSYKVSPNRLQVFIVNPSQDRSTAPIPHRK
jgi:hypothetical protein